MEQFGVAPSQAEQVSELLRTAKSIAIAATHDHYERAISGPVLAFAENPLDKKSDYAPAAVVSDAAVDRNVLPAYTEMDIIAQRDFQSKVEYVLRCGQLISDLRKNHTQEEFGLAA